MVRTGAVRRQRAGPALMSATGDAGHVQFLDDEPGSDHRTYAIECALATNGRPQLMRWTARRAPAASASGPRIEEGNIYGNLWARSRRIAAPALTGRNGSTQPDCHIPYSSGTGAHNGHSASPNYRALFTRQAPSPRRGHERWRCRLRASGCLGRGGASSVPLAPRPTQPCEPSRYACALRRHVRAAHTEAL